MKFRKYGLQKTSLVLILLLSVALLLTSQQAFAEDKDTGYPRPPFYRGPNPPPPVPTTPAFGTSGSGHPGSGHPGFTPPPPKGPAPGGPFPKGPILPPPPPPRIPGPPIPRLPSGHQPVWVGHNQYFYHHRDGAFYRRGPSGFISIRAPFGAIVFNIPIGSRAIMSGGMTYYVYDDVYYRRAGTQYVVVEPPRETVIVKETSPVVPSEPNVGEKVSVTAPLLNIRSGPGLNFPVVREVNQGEVLTVQGYAPDWLYVQLASGEFGWAMVKFTTPLAPPANG